MIIGQYNQLFSLRVYLNENELHRGLQIYRTVFLQQKFKAYREESKLNTLKGSVIFKKLIFLETHGTVL